jgi:hypothetical protein
MSRAKGPDALGDLDLAPTLALIHNITDARGLAAAAPE